MSIENMIAIKYIGIRDRYVDGAFGSMIEFEKGKPQLVPASLAYKMLRHSTVYERVEVEEKVKKKIKMRPVKEKKVAEDTVAEPEETLEAVEEEVPVAIVKEKEESNLLEDEAEIQNIRDSLWQMDADQVRDFISNNFAGQKIKSNITNKETLITKANGFIDQFGIPK